MHTCDICGHGRKEGIKLNNGFICSDCVKKNNLTEPVKTIQEEAAYYQAMAESHEKHLAEHAIECEKHRIPLEHQIWHLDMQPAGDDESGPYGYDEYAGTITLYGPFYGFDDQGTETIEIYREEDAKYLVEKLNKLIELERQVK